ncbi:hypothetical protein EX30DRAFT_348910 [Ascodesmis nigricans]|uniref:Uncharacterized protein n=1 Tax=Ascodesmis nigricans TaxID=341454 RepID=A0A4S2MWJ1_9PEZI|nr:hypothetical protein EX30DRAFT_348910 [Ascodesmis nigricans]
MADEGDEQRAIQLSTTVPVGDEPEAIDTGAIDSAKSESDIQNACMISKAVKVLISALGALVFMGAIRKCIADIEVFKCYTDLISDFPEVYKMLGKVADAVLTAQQKECFQITADSELDGSLVERDFSERLHKRGGVNLKLATAWMRTGRRKIGGEERARGAVGYFSLEGGNERG